jgi:DNA (cytosine-5)-methyltransferase 1
MTVIELFAGAGGASLGLLRAGFTEVRAVEWDASACATRRAAGLRCDEGDVRDLSHYEGVTADAVWSSFPCQAWSTAGKRLGKDDPRNGWPWTVDVLDQVKPRWFMAENVPGLTHHRGACNGRCADDCARLYFEQTILRELRERFAWVDYRILDAARFGVPQNRERLIIVAGPHAIDWPKETHAPPEELRTVGLFGETRKPWRTVREALNLSGALRPERGAGMCERHGERPDHSVDVN